MLPISTYNTIKERLKSGVYRSICLVKKLSSGEEEIIWSHNRIKDAEKPLAKLEYFRLKLNRELPAGDYEIQAKASIAHNAVDKFPVHVPEKKTPEPENKNVVEVFHDKYEQIEDSDFMDKEEYKRLLRENADLSGQLGLMTIERNWYKQMAESKEAKKEQELADKSSAGSVLADLAKETVPGIVNLVQDFISMRKSEAEAKKTERAGKVKINKGPVNPSEEMNLNKTVLYYFNLLNTDYDKANSELDLLEQQNPALYTKVYERLWPEGEEQQEEEEEGEEFEGEEFEQEEEEEGGEE